MRISREGWGLRDGTPPNKKKNTNKQEKNTNKQEKNTNKQGKTPTNKEKHLQTRKKHQQTRKKPFEQGKRLSSKGYLPIKCKSLQVVGVSGQGKAVVSDGG